MSQESNTESNSDDKPKKRLSLKKSGGSSATPSPVPPAPRPEPSAGTEKPFRMSFKKKDEEEAPTQPEATASPPPMSEEPPAEPEPVTPPPAPVTPPPSEEPPVKLGLKKPDSPEEDLPPPAPPPSPVAKKISILKAEDDEEERPGLLAAETRPPIPVRRPPVSGEGAPRPPTPPPGFTIHQDDDDEELPLPPPVSPLRSVPPALPTPDLMEEEIEAADLRSKKHSPLKGILVALVVFLFLVGGIGFLAWGVLGVFSGEDNETPPGTPAATAGLAPKAQAAPSAKEEPKGLIAKTTLLTQQVSEKASTEEITDIGEGSKPAPVAPAKAVETKAPEPGAPETVQVVSGARAGITRDVEPPPVAVRSSGDPEVRRWIEALRPSGIGRGIMLVDGEKYRIGEVINPQLNIRWVGVDQQLGILIFEDPYGVRYEKDY